jgi:phage shock protein PspC (stress-responsive transcriptional regulator)
VNDRLYRSVDDRVIGGVCGGLADRFDIDPSLIRIAWALVTILSGGVLFLLYIVMWIVVPEQPAPGSAGWRPAPPPGPDTMGGWQPPATGTAAGASAAGASGDTGAGTYGARAEGDGATATAWTPVGEPGEPGAPGAAPPPNTTAWVPPDEAYASRRAARAARRAERDRNGALVFGGILIVLGLWFLLDQYLPDIDLGQYWPVLLIGLGVVLLVGALGRRSRGEPPA